MAPLLILPSSARLCPEFWYGLRRSRPGGTIGWFWQHVHLQPTELPKERPKTRCRRSGALEDTLLTVFFVRAGSANHTRLHGVSVAVLCWPCIRIARVAHPSAGPSISFPSVPSIFSPLGTNVKLRARDGS